MCEMGALLHRWMQMYHVLMWVVHKVQKREKKKNQTTKKTRKR